MNGILWAKCFYDNILVIVKKNCIEEYLLRYFNTVLNKYGDKMLFAALNVSNDVTLIDASALLCIDFNELAT